MPSSELPEKFGDQVVPKKKWVQEYWAKKWPVSNSIDRTMPTVVKIAIEAAKIRMPLTICSTTLRAR